jgi:hypothetical protein
MPQNAAQLRLAESGSVAPAGASEPNHWAAYNKRIETMKKRLVLTACAVLVLSAVTAAILASSYHRVVVIEGISGIPIPDALVYLERSSGSPEEVGRTNVNGKFAFWSMPLPVPRIICAQTGFYPTTCVSAMGLSTHLIEFPIP